MRGERRTARTATLAAAAAGALALAASGSAGLAATGPQHARRHANRPPVVRLRAIHRRAPAGVQVVLDSSRSHDPDGRVVDHLWDLNGDGVFERDSSHRARIRHVFERVGKVRVAVRVVDDSGAWSTRRLRIRVLPTAADNRLVDRPTRRAGKHGRAGKRHGARVHAPIERRASAKRRGARPRPAAQSRTAAPRQIVHAASVATGDVTISDFKFAPASITVKVGDTVVWTNDGPTAHTATADDGSFDTGLLSKGATGSFKFTKAGKFSYHCTPHPFMKASVIVTGSSGNSSGGSSSNGSGSGGSNGSSGSSSSHGSSSLPHTGLEIASIVLAGLALLAGGAALRRRLSRA